MFDLTTVIAAIALYIGLLVLIAVRVERAADRGRNLANNALVYALSQVIFCSTWTYYGSVGFVAQSGLLFLTVYLGPTLALIFGWSVHRRLVRIKDSHRLTSLADFVAARYGKSQGVGALATALVVVGLVPYLGLQLKTMNATVAIISGHQQSTASYLEVSAKVGPLITAMMILFTIAFGIRRISPAERHPGMMVAISCECLVKLAGAVGAGLFVTYVLFDGFGDIFRRALLVPAFYPPLLPERGGPPILAWISHLILSASAFLFLPRQFHVAVVENSEEQHIRTALWLVPLYLLAITLFVLPVTMGGLLAGHAPAAADAFVLSLPADTGYKWVSMLVFLGGFSAGAGMITVEAMTLATMISNHLLLPLLAQVQRLGFLRRHLLLCRWVAAAAVIIAASGFERTFGQRRELVGLGLVSFTAVLQLAPAVLGGLYWRGANKAGALLGLSAGGLVWVYTLVVPEFVRIGLLPLRLLEQGPWGVALLRPEQLLGLGGLDPITHAVVWTLVFNIALFLGGSLFYRADEQQLLQAERLVEILRPEEAVGHRARQPALIDLATTRERVERFFRDYHDEQLSRRVSQACLTAAAPGATDKLTISQLGQVEAEVEKALAASIGTAAAHSAVRRGALLLPAESRELSRSYAEALAEMKVSPAELRQRVDYFRARESLLAKEATTNRLLASASSQLASSLDYESTLHAAAWVAVPAFADGALLCVKESPFLGIQGERYRYVVAHRESARASRAQERLRQVVPEAAALPRVQRAWSTGQAVIAVPDSAASWPAEALAEIPVTSTITLPLVAGGQVFGTLALFFSEQSAFQYPEDRAVAEELARNCAAAINSADQYRRAQAAIQARDEFLAIASHELKTPLTPLALQVQTLNRLAQRGELAHLDPEKLSHLLKSSNDQIRRLASLVSDLLDVSRITTGRLKLNLEETDLSVVVAEVVERFSPALAAAGCQVELQATPGLVGRWDRLRVEQVLTNLLDNARKYASGKPVRVEVRPGGAMAQLVVQDQGIGVPKEAQERIFLPFERAVPYLRAGGFGLGLYIVRQIVEAHAGAIRIQSQPGVGSTFTVELPLAATAGS